MQIVPCGHYNLVAIRWRHQYSTHSNPVLFRSTFTIRFTAFSIIIKYTSSNIRDWQEICLISVGQLSCTIILSLATLVSIALSFALDSLPYIVSKFVIAFGSMTVLDPMLILIVDLIQGNWNCESRGGGKREREGVKGGGCSKL